MDNTTAILNKQNGTPPKSFCSLQCIIWTSVVNIPPISIYLVRLPNSMANVLSCEPEVCGRSTLLTFISMLCPGHKLRDSVLFGCTVLPNIFWSSGTYVQVRDKVSSLYHVKQHRGHKRRMTDCLPMILILWVVSCVENPSNHSL